MIQGSNISVGQVGVDLVLNQNSFNKEVGGTIKSTEFSFKNAMKKIGGYVATAFAVKEVVSFGKVAVETASQMQSAWTGLNSIVQGTGKSFSTAQKFIADYTKDGLVSVNEAVTSYKNLLSRGYDTSQIEGTLNALKDSASFGRQASYDLGEAVVTATEGLKNENSILVDNAGVTKNVAKMWDEYARSIGKTSTSLTQAEKIQAEYKGILKETQFQTGDAITYANTFSGQIQRLRASFTSLKVAVGQVVTPIAQLFIPVINSAVEALTRLFNGIYKVLNLFGLEFKEVMTKSGAPVAKLTDDFKGAGDSAVKTAKKINKAFANVDEIHVLNPTKSTSDSGADASGGGGISSGLNISGDINESTNATSKFVEKIKELASIFKEGFKNSFGNTNFDSIITSANNTKKAIQRIFSDPEVKKSANEWAQTVSFSLGQVVGGVSRTGINIANALIGGIEKYITQNSDRIKKFIKNMFNITAKDFKLTGEFFKALGEISDVLNSDTAKQIVANITAVFVNPLMSIIEFATKFVTDFKALFMQPIIDNVDKIKQAVENTLAPIETITGTLSTAFTYIGDKLNEIYDNSIGPFMESLKTGISDTFGKFLDVYNEHIAPFLERFANGIKSLWDEHLKPFVYNIAGFVSAIVNSIQILWENWIKPLIDWIVQNIVPKVVPVFETVWNVVKSVFGSIIDVINGIIEFFKGLINFIRGVFTADWSKAWEVIKSIVVNSIGGGIKNAFYSIKNTISSVMNSVKTTMSNIWNAIWNTIKGIINKIISGVEKMCNTVIKGLNKIIEPLTKVGNSILSALGIKNFSFSAIKEVTLPRLYQGGYAQKNNPQLAIVGDNKREGEIISPESKIYEQAYKAVKDAGGSGKQQLEITIYHKYEDGKTIIQKINQAEIDAGEILLLT